MQSKAPSVIAYIAEAPEERQPALRKLRALYRKHFHGFTETMEYGMPCYRKGDAVYAFASQKQYVAVYLNTKVLAENREALRGVPKGKSCLRYASVEKMDFGLIARLVEETGKRSRTPKTA